MSELDKNTFTRGEFSRSGNNSAFSVRSGNDGIWRATQTSRVSSQTMGLSANRPEVKVEPKKEKLKEEPEFRERPRRHHEPRRWPILGLTLVIVQIITSVLLMISLITMNIISGRWIALVGGILTILAILSAIKLLFHKNASNASKIACGTVSVIAIVLSIFALRYTDAFNGFLNKVTERKPETKQYSVVVMEQSEIKELPELSKKNVGFLKNDEKAGNAENYLLEKVQFTANFYDDADTLAKVLNTNIVDAIVLETDRMEILKEEAEDSVKNTRVIYTFEIEIEAKNAEISEKQLTKDPFVLYISGSDSRNGVKARARSDVNILAVVNPAKGKILLVSIPRDTYVQLHGTTGIKDKLTHAGVYGINMSRDTIEDFLGVNIDYTVKVSFDTVVKVVDQLGGIEIDSDQEMTLKDGELLKDKVCHYTVGKQKVDGDCALRFARERKSYKTGDRHRGENQMQVITAIVSKLSESKDYILRLPEILNIAADSFETSLTRDDISSFIRMQLNNGTKWEVESISVDGTGSMQGTYSMGASRPLYVMIPSQDSVNSAVSKIREYLSV
ncbi:LCP family protein [Candidatus Saccharibacteria bacterium]|nr:LCP family protein [Candidatus Saccharibacteria bacterium]